ncbi:MAG: DUF4258 domain-containing protein [Candidatus Micrarchaeota archaeon]
MKRIISGHALKRMYERNISPDEVNNVMNKGMKWFAKNEGAIGRWHAKMGNVEIVFEKTVNKTTVVTVYWVA